MNTGPTLRQPDWWNCEDEITSISRNITGKLGEFFYKPLLANPGKLIQKISRNF